jgi:sporulation protein YlmC with PRC-barrel domain
MAVMTETQFTIGAEASCTDGKCGHVIRVVVDPVARTVTHLVVEPEGRVGLGRLVPVDLVDAADGEVRIRCSLADFEKFESAEETQFVPGTLGYAAYGPAQVIAWPYFGLAGGGVSGDLAPGVSETVTVDAVPLGEVEVRRGEQVHATDGNIGRVEGLVMEPSSRKVTHVLLQEGHLWGRKEVAIPIGAVAEVGEDGIRLTISKREVEDLPPVEVDRHDR